MGLLVKQLPRYTGPHTVSTLDLEVPVETRRTFGDATLKQTGQPALQLDTVLITLYYPADPNRPASGQHQPWVSRPLNQTAAGYARFANQRPWLVKAIVWLFARGVRLPVEAERPLESSATSTDHDPPPTDARSHDSHRTVVGNDDTPSQAKTRFPVVVFSHGLSGTRTTYSQWCGEIASRGYVVAAIEHRDGSGPISVVRRADGTQERVVDYIRPEHLSWPAGKKPLTSLEFRAEQLEMRLAEVTETLSALQQLDAGNGADLARANRRRSFKSRVEEWLPAWKDRLDLTDRVVMAGHSFGGATAIQVLRAGSTAFPFRRGIALDPWADPIPPAPSLSAAGSAFDSPTSSKLDPAIDPTGPPLDIVAPLLVINSETFTLWKEHYVLVRDIVTSIKRGADRWLMTMIGSVHMSFSDLPLLAPLITRRTGARVDSQLATDRFVEACDEFLRGEANGPILGEVVRDGDEAGARPGEGDKEADGKRRRPMAGDPGSMRMHVRP
ncbi:hypothetical protein JCM3774_003339 [Rhodotorula dairenensis]